MVIFSSFVLFYIYFFTYYFIVFIILINSSVVFISLPSSPPAKKLKLLGKYIPVYTIMKYARLWCTIMKSGTSPRRCGRIISRRINLLKMHRPKQQDGSQENHWMIKVDINPQLHPTPIKLCQTV